MNWQRQSWRYSPDYISADTEHGIFCIQRLPDSLTWELSIRLDYAEQPVTLQTSNNQVELKEFAMQEASRRDWYKLDTPGGKAPIERLAEAGYKCELVDDKPALMAVSELPTHFTNPKFVGNYTSANAIRELIYKLEPLSLNPWPTPVAKSGWTNKL